MGNQRIQIRDRHHEWLKAKAKASGRTMGELLEELIEAGIALDVPGAKVRRGYKRAEDGGDRG